MSASVIYSVVNYRRKCQDDVPQAGDVIYSQVKFPNSLPCQSVSQDGRALPQGEDVIYSQVKFQPIHTAGLQADTEQTQKTIYSRYRLISVGLGLLFLLLFIIIIFLSANLHRGNQSRSLMEDNLKQLQTNYSSLANENEQIQNDCGILAKEKGRLQEEYSLLAKEKERLQGECNMLANDKGQLQEEYSMLDNSKSQLQNKYNTLADSKSQLQNEYNELTYSKRQLQNEYNTLTYSKRQLQGEYNKLKDGLQKNHSALANNYQQEINALINKLPFLKEYCNAEKVCNPCPNGWKIFNHKCYYHSQNKRNWEESKTDCSRYGADLVVIESQEEQDFIRTIINKMNSWIGLTDRKEEGTWLWVDGTQLEKSFWARGKPNDLPDLSIAIRHADCVYFQAKDAVWFDDTCGRDLNFLCETDALSVGYV